MNFSGQDMQVSEYLEAHGCQLHKWRLDHMLCGFSSAQNRTDFKAAVAGISGIAMTDVEEPDFPDLFVVRVDAA